MKKSTLLLIINLLLLIDCYGQNDPCSAYPLDVTKSITVGQMVPPFTAPNLNLPCGSAGEVENPIWWSFRPSVNFITISMSANSCTPGGCGIGVQTTIWEGDKCGLISAIDCQVGLSMTYSLGVDPCKTYYLQADGLCGAICKIVITYDKNQLLGSVPPPSIVGNKQICKGATGKYCASFPIQNCEASTYKWTLIPANAGTIALIAGEEDCANIKITNPPASGKVQVCAEPVFVGKSLPTTQKSCYEIEVVDLKPATCSVKICSEQNPYAYDLKECIKTTNAGFAAEVIPSTYTINLPAGTKKTQVVSYTLNGTTCSNNVTLNIEVADNKPVTLAPLLLCDGETQTIKGTSFTCADASTNLKAFVKEGISKPMQCDTTYKMLVQCLKVTPKITGVSALDCSKTQVILDATGTNMSTLPNNFSNNVFQGVGTRQYAWSKDGNLLAGATNATLVVTAAGVYEVTLTYTYKVTQTINGQQGTWNKTCSKTASVTIIGTTTTTVAETPIESSNSCVNGTAFYHISPDVNAQSYQWSVTGGATIIGSNNNPLKLEVKNNGTPYQVCLVKKACNKTSVPTCISITPIAAPIKPIIGGLKSVCKGDSAFYEVSNAASYSTSVHYSWIVSNGVITNYNTDSTQILIKWTQAASNGKVLLKVNDLCGSAKDSLNITIKSCACGIGNAGKMNLKFILTANKLTKKITVKHQNGTQILGINDTYAFVLHNGSATQMGTVISVNQTGTFSFDATKMICNRIYFVAYVVGKAINGLPNLQDSCLSIVPKAQAIAWLCPKKTTTSVAREDYEITTQNTDYQVNIYPNPTEDKFFIEIPSVKNATLDLYNTQGQIVLSQKDMIPLSANQYEAPVAHLPKGVYVLKMNLDGKSEIRKVIIE